MEGRAMSDRPKRYLLTYPVQLITEDFYEEGMTLNASGRGLAVATSRLLGPGTYLYVRVVVPERRHSIDLQMCRVLWCRGHRMGLETLGMDPNERAQWQKIILSRRGPVREEQPAPVTLHRIDGFKAFFSFAFRLFKEKPTVIEELNRVA
jgi:hypothetical protein